MPRTRAQRLSGLARVIGSVDALLVGGPSGTQPRVEATWTGEDVSGERYADGGGNEMEIDDIDREMVGEAELMAMLRGPARHGPWE